MISYPKLLSSVGISPASRYHKEVVETYKGTKVRFFFLLFEYLVPDMNTRRL